MEKIFDWIIHLCMNGVCDKCGEKETGFHQYICNAHTHGMDKYGHLDFQLVINLPQAEIGRILNTLGLRVKAGERFKDGDLVSGIYEDCEIRLTIFEEDKRKVLRVIIPDKQNRFPEDEGCDYPYIMQGVYEENLYHKRGLII